MSRIAKAVALQILRGYKGVISPLFLPACRYVPSCSEYAMDAIEWYGVAVGSMKAVGRVLRCHPLSKGGYDPVSVSEENNSRTRTVASKLCSH